MFNVVKVLEKGAIGLLLALDSIVYNLIGKAYNIFMAIAGARLLSADAYMKVANKVYAIVGVLMLFVLSYSILRSIIDPDKNLKEELGAKMVQRIVIAVVGLAMTPVLFNLLYQAQGLILESNILGNLFFNDEVLDDGTDPNSYLTDIGGSVTATSLWQAFFYPSEASGLNPDEIKGNAGSYLIAVTSLATCAGFSAAAAFFIGVPIVNFLAVGAAVISCINAGQAAADAVTGNGEEITLQEAYSRTAAGDNFNIYVAFMDNYVDDGEITYTFILSTIAGGFCLYAFISFSIDMGVRAAKMAYLQIVAPIPLIMQVIPSNKDMFDKYLKSVKNTFMEVFIRISVVYVVVYIICHLPQLFSSTTALWGNKSLDGPSKVLALALLILGLIAFCRKAPDIISETLNIPKGDMKLGLREKLAEGGAFAAGGILGAAATSGFRGAANYKVPDNRKGQHFRNALTRMGRGVGGFFGAGARAAWNQFGPGEDKHEAKNWKDTVNVASRASRAQDDHTAAVDQRRENRDRISDQIEEQRKEIIKLNQEYATETDPAKLNEIREKLKAAHQKMSDLQEEYFANTEIGNLYEDRKKRVKIWATGSFDLTVEDASIKLGAAMGNIQDKLRAQAENKDEVTKALADQLAKEQAREISHYRDGWTEESYNEAIRTEIRSGSTEGTAYSSAATVQRSKLAAHDAARTSLNTAEDELKKAQEDLSSGAITQAEFDAKKSARDAASTAFVTAKQELDKANEDVETAMKAIEAKIGGKYTDEEYQKLVLEHQRKVDGLKKAKEARQDEWAQAQLARAKGGEEMQEIVVSELREHMDLLQNHPNARVPIKGEGGEIEYITVAELVQRNFGASAIDGQLVASDFSDKPVEFDITLGDKKTKKKVVHTVNSDGTESYTIDGRTYQPGEYSEYLSGLISSYGISEISPSSQAAKAKDQGKQVRTILPTTPEYTRKKNLEREKAESKK